MKSIKVIVFSIGILLTASLHALSYQYRVSIPEPYGTSKIIKEETNVVVRQRHKKLIKWILMIKHSFHIIKVSKLPFTKISINDNLKQDKHDKQDRLRRQDKNKPRKEYTEREKPPLTKSKRLRRFDLVRSSSNSTLSNLMKNFLVRSSHIVNILCG